MISTRAFASAVSGAYRRVSSRASVTTSPAVQLADEREQAAQPVDQGQRQRRDQGQGRDEDELQHRGADADVAHAAGPERELAGFVVGAAEQLDQGGAGSGEPLGHLGAHGGVVVGGLAPQVGQPGAHPAGRAAGRSAAGSRPAAVTCQDVFSMTTRVRISATTLLTTPESVPAKARCAPITSLFSRLTSAPVRVRVKNAIGIFCTWSKTAVRRSRMTPSPMVGGHPARHQPIPASAIATIAISTASQITVLDVRFGDDRVHYPAGEDRGGDRQRRPSRRRAARRP